MFFINLRSFSGNLPYSQRYIQNYPSTNAPPWLSHRINSKHNEPNCESYLQYISAPYTFNSHQFLQPPATARRNWGFHAWKIIQAALLKSKIQISQPRYTPASVWHIYAAANSVSHSKRRYKAQTAPRGIQVCTGMAVAPLQSGSSWRTLTHRKSNHVCNAMYVSASVPPDLRDANRFSGLCHEEETSAEAAVKAGDRFVAIEKHITVRHREASWLTMPVTCHHPLWTVPTASFF